MKSIEFCFIKKCFSENIQLLLALIAIIKNIIGKNTHFLEIVPYDV